MQATLSRVARGAAAWAGASVARAAADAVTRAATDAGAALELQRGIPSFVVAPERCIDITHVVSVSNDRATTPAMGAGGSWRRAHVQAATSANMVSAASRPSAAVHAPHL